jgi:KTSC domain-containing protein
MRITGVDSTTLAVVAYDEARELLQLEFRSRTVYRYFGVPARVHGDLLRAPSHGRYFNAEIRGRFRWARITKAGEA